MNAALHTATPRPPKPRRTRAWLAWLGGVIELMALWRARWRLKHRG
jgi:hypothetical protein